MFRVGQKVVAVRVGPSLFDGKLPCNLVKGAVYTVISSGDEGRGILVAEATPPDCKRYDATRFRLLQSTETGMAVLRGNARKATQGVDA